MWRHAACAATQQQFKQLTFLKLVFSAEGRKLISLTSMTAEAVVQRSASTRATAASVVCRMALQVCVRYDGDAVLLLTGRTELRVSAWTCERRPVLHEQSTAVEV